MSAHGKPRFPYQEEREVDVKFARTYRVTLGLDTSNEWEVLEVQVPGEDEGHWSRDISSLLAEHASALWDAICEQAIADVIEQEKDDCEEAEA